MSPILSLGIGYLRLKPKTNKSEKAKSTVVLPKGELKQIYINVLCGNGDKIHISVSCEGKLLYASFKKDNLSVGNIKLVTLEDCVLENESNSFELEGYNRDNDLTSCVSFEFGFYPYFGENPKPVIKKGQR